MTAAARGSARPRRPAPDAAALAGTGALTQLALRRDRIMLPVWVYVVVIGRRRRTPSPSPGCTRRPSSRASLVSSGLDNPALLFLYGRLNGDSVGALTAWRYGVWGALFAALMSVFLVVRHTRGDEEAGRLELVRLGPGRPAGAADVGDRRRGARQRGPRRRCCAWCCRCSACRRPGSAALALAIGTCGLAFTGVSAGRGPAHGRAPGPRAAWRIGVLGVAFLARAVGDAAGASGPSWLTWVLPLGWTEMLRPFAGERWWVLALPRRAVLGGHLAGVRAGRRGVTSGPGLLADRPAGRPRRPRCAGRSRSRRGCSGRPSRAGRPGTRSCSRSAAPPPRASASWSAAAARCTKEFTRIGGQAAIVNAYLAALMLLGGLVAAAYGGIRGAPAARRGDGGPRRPGPRRVGRPGAVGAEPPAGRRRGARRCCSWSRASRPVSATASRVGGAGHETARMLGAGLAQLPGGAGDRRRRGAGRRRAARRVRGGRAGRRSGSPCC